MKKKDKVDQQEGQMSFSEKIKKEERDESASYGSVSTSGLKGIQFPISNDAIENLKLIGENKIDLLILKIENEKFEVDFAGQCDISEVQSKVAKIEPRFIFFFNYNHNFEDKDMIVFYFIYCCPTDSKVKERMKYSSSKSTITSYGSEHGIIFKNAPNIEVSDAIDLTKDFLHNYIHPVKVEEVVFKKPAKPNARPKK